MDRAAADASYRSYIARCNAHEFALLGEYVAEDARVNDESVGLQGYIAGLQTMVDAVPDFHWELRHLVVDPPWLAAHFTDTGTLRGEPGAPGRSVRLQEFALYRLVDGRIAEVWGDLPDFSRPLR